MVNRLEWSLPNL